jgi:serine/threonine protein phosphatase PrpC
MSKKTNCSSQIYNVIKTTHQNIQHESYIGKRSIQQDRYCIFDVDIPNLKNGKGILFAVMDGHLDEGHIVAELVARQLVLYFRQSLKLSNGDIPHALKILFDNLIELTCNERSGTTASVVYLPFKSDFAYLAVLGDSPILICHTDDSYFMSPMHNLNNALSLNVRAIEKAGGWVDDKFIYYNNYRIQLTSSLGDNIFGGIINKTPEIFKVKFGQESLLLIGSDGLLSPKDTHLNQIELIRKILINNKNVKKLIESALNEGSVDNITAILYYR